MLWFSLQEPIAINLGTERKWLKRKAGYRVTKVKNVFYYVPLLLSLKVSDCYSIMLLHNNYYAHAGVIVQS